MIDTFNSRPGLMGDKPAAASMQGLADRGVLALIALERTRMPMVVSDPTAPDNPIVIANQAFLNLTGYSADEVVGRNCRFLQGPLTDPAAVDIIRRGIATDVEVTTEMLNYRKDGTQFWNELHISPIRDDNGHVIYHFASQKDVTDRRQAQLLERVEHRLLKEVDHRAKNALALVQGIVRLSRADDPVAYAGAVQGRVDALSRAHGLLASRGWRHVDLGTILAGELEPFGRQHVVASGPRVAIAAVQVQPLSLVLHEMLSNAAMHGALSVAAGLVTIGWSVDADDLVTIRWTETGGPAPVMTPVPGFGWRMIGGIVQSQMRGATAFDMPPEGLIATLTLRKRSGGTKDLDIGPGV